MEWSNSSDPFTTPSPQPAALSDGSSTTTGSRKKRGGKGKGKGKGTDSPTSRSNEASPNNSPKHAAGNSDMSGPNASPDIGPESSLHSTKPSDLTDPDEISSISQDSLELPETNPYQTGSDGRMRAKFNPSPLTRPPRPSNSGGSMSRSASVPDLGQVAISVHKSDSVPNLNKMERVIQVEDEYGGGIFVRKGTALSPIVSARRNSSPSAHNRTRSYSSGGGMESFGCTTPSRSSETGEEVKRTHRRTKSAEAPTTLNFSNGSNTTTNSLHNDNFFAGSTAGESPEQSTNASSPIDSVLATPANGGSMMNPSPVDPYTHFTNFQRSTNWRVRRGQPGLNPVHTAEYGQSNAHIPKKHKWIPIPPAPISGWKLFRLRLLLAVLYGFYALWFVCDIGFMIYCQLVKMGVPVEIQWERMRWAVEWYHPDKGTWLETLVIVIPKVVTFTWVFMSISSFFFTCFSFKDEPNLWLPDFLDEADYPTVDILLPRYKEPWDIYMPTVRASLGMDYPASKINVYICDDGNRSGVGVEEKLRAEFGTGTMNNLHYITRKDGKHAKAGNLNNCLKQSSGDLIVVFDADMIAEKSFLKTLIPHLIVWDELEGGYALSDVAFVQTDQAFYNNKHPMVVMMDGPNLMYYRLIMLGLNGINGAAMVGTGFVLQRAAIKEIGGFITAYSVEDVTTTLALHQRGWRTKYKYTGLVKGLSPATLQEFFKQRLRWGAGSAQLLCYIAPLSLKGLTLGQRIGNFTSHNYWAVTFIMYVFMMIRYALWIIYLYISPESDGQYENRQMFMLPSQFLPVLVAMLSLPNVPFLSKLMTMMSMLTYAPVYARIAWFMMIGKLHPTNPRGGTLKVKSSSESYGNALPSEAYFNVALTFFITGACIFFAVVPQAGIGPDIKGPLYYIQLATVFVFIWFANLPVMYEVVNIAFFDSADDEQEEQAAK